MTWVTALGSLAGVLMLTGAAWALGLGDAVHGGCDDRGDGGQG